MTTPRLDAEVLLAEALGMDRVGLYIHFDRPLRSDELAVYKKMIQRRLLHEPLAYILGYREFWSLKFKVNPDVLIPRPETEGIVTEALKIFSPEDQPQKKISILEIGTGCGAISIALARELPNASLVATDISEKALSIAEENARQNGVRDRMVFLQGDLFQPLEKGRRFELILSNPPYIPRNQIPFLPPEIRDFEPRPALDGGEDGLNFFREALLQVEEYLKPYGWFLAEIGEGQEPEVLRIAGGNPDLDSFCFIPDLAGIKRVFKARRKSAL